MRKILLLVIAISGVLFTANAQKGGFEIRVGYSNSTSKLVIGSTKTKGDDISGFHVGGLFSKIVKNKGVEIGLLYSHYSEDKLTNQYLTLPVMPKYYVTEDLSLLVGTQFDFHLGASYETTNISLGLGTGYDIGNVVVSARYFWGLTNHYKEGRSDAKLTLNTFQLSLGLML